jgi:hypothetical protein
MTRLLLTLGTLALALAVYALMRKGWRGRVRRQADLPEPPVPTGHATVLAGPVPGLLVGTTFAEDWLDRVAAHHLSDRATGSLSVAEDGVHVQREPLPELFLPWGSLDSADVETGLGGKVVRTGMLLLTWRLGGRTLRSGFRADDHAQHRRLADAVRAHLPVRESS